MDFGAHRTVPCFFGIEGCRAHSSVRPCGSGGLPAHSPFTIGIFAQSQELRSKGRNGPLVLLLINVAVIPIHARLIPPILQNPQPRLSVIAHPRFPRLKILGGHTATLSTMCGRDGTFGPDVRRVAESERRLGSLDGRTPVPSWLLY